MLFDPKWNNPNFHGVGLREFIAWLETKDPTEAYDYGNPQACATGQYLRAQGHKEVSVQFHEEDNEQGKWLWAIVSPYCSGGPCTFGAALERARATLLAE